MNKFNKEVFKQSMKKYGFYGGFLAVIYLIFSVVMSFFSAIGSLDEMILR